MSLWGEMAIAICYTSWRDILQPAELRQGETGSESGFTWEGEVYEVPGSSWTSRAASAAVNARGGEATLCLLVIGKAPPKKKGESIHCTHQEVPAT